MPDILNLGIGEHRPTRNSATPKSPLWTIRYEHLMPTVLDSSDGWIKRRQSFTVVESGDVVLLLPWPISLCRGGFLRNGMQSKNAKTRRSLNGRCQRTATREGQSGSTQPSPRVSMSWERGDLEHTGAQLPLLRPRHRIRGDGGCSAGVHHRGGRLKSRVVAPARRKRLR